MARIGWKVQIKYNVYPDNPRATALSRELETKKGRLGVIVGMLLFVIGGIAGGMMMNLGDGPVIAWFCFVVAASILIPVMLEVRRTDRFKADIDSALGTPKEQRSKPGFPAVGIVCFLILGALLVWFILAFGEGGGAYSDAQKLMNEGRYAEAREAFEAMGDYKDAKKMAREAQYQQGLQAMEEGRYEEAVKLLEKLSGMNAKTAHDKAMKAWINERDAIITEANAYMEKEEYVEAARLYGSIAHNYRHATELCQEAWLKAAQAALGKKDYAAAAEYFGNVEGEDGVQGKRQANYLLGNELMEKGDYAGAADVLAQAEDYEDAPALLKTARYEAGTRLLAAGDGDGAYAYFVRLSGFRDTDTLLQNDERLLKAAQNALKQPGSLILFGHYEQDNNEENGSEPILWKVWDTRAGSGLLVSEDILEELPYDTNGDGYDWSKSTLCAYLNRVFFLTAFSEEERTRILKNDTVYTDGSVSLSVTLPSSDIDFSKGKDLNTLVSRPSVYAESRVADPEHQFDWWYAGSDSHSTPYTYMYQNNRSPKYTDEKEIRGVRPAILLAVPEN